MSVLKWSAPFEETDSLRRELAQWFASAATSAAGHVVPPVEVIETEGAYRFNMLLPGMPAEALGEYVHIDATAKTLVITGEFPERKLEPGEKSVLSQFPAGPFSKQISFPDGIEHEQIEARYRNGILEVTLPKAITTRKRSVQIQLG